MTTATIQPRKLVLHHHLFKNAGSSLDRTLEQNYGDSWVTLESDDPGGRLWFEEILEFFDERPHVRALSSHQLVPQRPDGPWRDRFEIFPIVVLREPISRVRSAYLFEWQKQVGRDTPKGTLAEYIVEKLKSPRESIIGDFHIGRLSAADRRHYELRESSHDAERELRLELAASYLEAVPVFGIVERYDTFIKLLNIHLGSFDSNSPLLSSFETNVLQNPGLSVEEVHDVIRADIGQGLFDELLDRNQGDLKLYDLALRRFERLATAMERDPNPANAHGGSSGKLTIDSTTKPTSNPTANPTAKTATEMPVEFSEPMSQLASANDRLQRRIRWQSDLLQRQRNEHDQERQQLDSLRTKYCATLRRAMKAEASEPDLPEGELPPRKLSKALRLAQAAVGFADRAVNYAERRIKDYPVSPEHQHLRAKIANSGFFDTEFYVATYPDVVELGWDPIDHYLIHGGLEGRAASEIFDTGWYLQRYPDVAEAGWHPLIHYLDHGEREGRHIRAISQDLYGNEPPYGSFELPQREEFAQLAAQLAFPIHSDAEVEITIVVPIFNAMDHTLLCLKSLTELATKRRYEVLIMDDCSTDPDVKLLETITGLRYHRNDLNLGFLENCNRSADLARGEYLVLLNNDTTVDPGWLDALRDTFDTQALAGVVGSKLVFPDGRLQEAGGIVWQDAGGWNWGRLLDPNHPRFNYVRDVDYVSGASFMVPLDLFKKLGRFDQRFRPAYYEDTDFCFTVRQEGWRVIYQPASIVVHYEGVSSGTDLGAGVKRHQVTNRGVFSEKWADVLAGHGPNGQNPLLASDRRPSGHVLIVDSCVPTPDRDSGSLDMINLIKILHQLGKRVHFFPLHNRHPDEPYTRHLQQLGAVTIHEPHFESLDDYLAETSSLFETVILSRVDPATQSIDVVHQRCPDAKVLFYTVDLHHLRDAREAGLSGDHQAAERAAERKRQELCLMDKVDVTIVLSDIEHRLLAEAGKTNIEVLPLIREVSTDEVPHFEDRDGVVFVGGFRHPPNADAVHWLLDEVWPCVRAEAQRRNIKAPPLSIVGSHMPEYLWNHDGDGVAVLGFVENLRPIFARSRLSIAPLRYGAGLKGKVATSLDFGVPVVGTAMAFEGMPGPGLDLVKYQSDDPSKLAALILDLHNDRQRWLEASVAGRHYVQRNYSIEALTPVVARLVGEGHPEISLDSLSLVDASEGPLPPAPPPTAVETATTGPRS